MVCEKCGYRLEPNSVFCPHCGTPCKQQPPQNTVATEKESNGQRNEKKANNVPPPQSPPAAQAVKRKHPAIRAVVTFGIVLFLIIRLVAFFFPGGPSSQTIFDCAQTVINMELKSPGSASYSHDKILDHDSYGRYLVYADVDAQNSFGAYLRSSYVVLVWNVQSDGKFTYNPLLSAVSLDSMEQDTAVQLLKEENDWGKPISTSSNS